MNYPEMLAPMHAAYDDSVKMTKYPAHAHVYHSKIKVEDTPFVHNVIDSLKYARGLLASGDAARAGEIIKKVISLQDTDENSVTFGVWPYYLEESLAQMSPPDHNWADFCGQSLICSLVECGHLLDGALRKTMLCAIDRAAAGILRRNCPADYTNIAIKGSLVTHMAGALLDKPVYAEWAMNKLSQVYADTVETGTFSEYNSPCYGLVVIQDLKQILNFSKDPEFLRLAEELYYLAWKCTAEHYHPQTGQWAGPHWRSYSPLLSSGTRAFLDFAVRKKEPSDPSALGLDAWLIKPYCPDTLVPFFDPQGQSAAPRVVVEKIYRVSEDNFCASDGFADMIHKADKAEVYLESYAYLTERFTLSSANWSDTWHQRYNIISYFGTCQEPAYFRVRCLHDDFDFSAGALRVDQNQNALSAELAFNSEGCDTHVLLDPIKDGTITAKNLKLIFEMGGDIENASAETDGSGFFFTNRERKITVRVSRADCAGFTPVFAVKRCDGTLCGEITIYEGEPRSIDLRAFKPWFCAFDIEVV
jgi:hypothetical protein